MLKNLYFNCKTLKGDVNFIKGKTAPTKFPEGESYRARFCQCWEIWLDFFEPLFLTVDIEGGLKAETVRGRHQLRRTSGMVCEFHGIAGFVQPTQHNMVMRAGILD
ncbi:MAG: hypothetical protein RLY49_530 [Candidatus Parcubacteria bacterium]|jgi:hypothetical protein